MVVRKLNHVGARDHRVLGLRNRLGGGCSDEQRTQDASGSEWEHFVCRVFAEPARIKSIFNGFLFCLLLLVYIPVMRL